MPLFGFPIHNNNKTWCMQYIVAMLYIKVKIMPFIYVLQDLAHLMARLMQQQMTNIYPIKQKGPSHPYQFDKLTFSFRNILYAAWVKVL